MKRSVGIVKSSDRNKAAVFVFKKQWQISN